MNEEGKNVLPVDFDGIFRFTNFTDRDFKAKWNNVEYTFPALKTVPMIIPNATPEEVQNIRKKFAKELGEREFFGSDRLKGLEGQTPVGQGNSIQSAASYTDKDLTGYIQRCLEPLPISTAKITLAPKSNIEKILKTDDEGEPVSQVLDAKSKKSILKDTGTVIA